jgi:hypothetical protein
MRKWRTAILWSSALALPACAYLADRYRDIGDVITLQAGTGIGLHADVKATDAARAGVGAARLDAWRIGERSVRSRPDFQVGLPLSLAAWIPAVGSGRLDRAAALHVDNRSLAEDRFVRKLDVEAGFTLGVAGARAGVRLGEILDFVAGFVGLDPADDDAGDAGERAYRAEMKRRGRWFPGDPHVHVSPPDSPPHVKARLRETLAMARRRGLDWLILTPHYWGTQEADVLVYLDPEAFLEDEPRVEVLPSRDPLVCLGLEVTRRAHGAFVTANHPFVRTLRVPILGLRLGRDLGWDQPLDHADLVDALEAYNYLWDLGERFVLLGRDERSLARTFAAADRAVVERRRRIVVTGTSDNHSDYLISTTWVFAPRPLTREGLEAGLRAGRVCVVNDEPSTFRARSDREPAWRGIGERLEAAREVELRWRGRGELIVDGVSMGVRRGGYRHRLEEPGGFHAYRLVARGGYSNYIFVNGP